MPLVAGADSINIREFIMHKALILLLLAVVFTVSIFAVDDVEVNLDGTTATDVFSVKNSTPENLLKVDGTGNLNVKPGSYMNYGETTGSTGYGFRDNSGVLEYKNSAGVWTPWTNSYGDGVGTFSYGQIAYNHGDYLTTQPSVTPGPSTGYLSLLPASIGTLGVNFDVIQSGNVYVEYLNDKPAYLRIAAPGYYRISANIALLGTNNSSLEVEIFRQNSATIPAVSSWITGTHDLESLSTAISNTNGQYDAGAMSGIVYLSTNDYIALCARVMSGAAVSQKIISVNLNVERVK